MFHSLLMNTTSSSCHKALCDQRDCSSCLLLHSCPLATAAGPERARQGLCCWATQLCSWQKIFLSAVYCINISPWEFCHRCSPEAEREKQLLTSWRLRSGEEAAGLPEGSGWAGLEGSVGQLEAGGMPEAESLQPSPEKPLEPQSGCLGQRGPCSDHRLWGSRDPLLGLSERQQCGVCGAESPISH